MTEGVILVIPAEAGIHGPASPIPTMGPPRLPAGVTRKEGCGRSPDVFQLGRLTASPPLPVAAPVGSGDFIRSNVRFEY